MTGITAYGAYIPRRRMPKQAIAAANAWFDPALQSLASGERSFCNWDEDSLTMAVEAAQDCLSMSAGKFPRAVYLASTTLPFLDRQNSVVLIEALNLARDIRSMDVTSSQRAGMSALISGLDFVQANGTCNALVVASEKRRSTVGSREEMQRGDAAAAIEFGNEDVIAEVLASHSEAVDFVDHYRGGEQSTDYQWEERWIRDEGYLKIVPHAVNMLLDKAQLTASDIDHFVLSSEQKRVPLSVATRIGIPTESLVPGLVNECGISGVAHPMLLLARTLETAKSGDLILVIGFGQGCDAVLFRATDNIDKRWPALGVSGNLKRGVSDDNYHRYMSFNKLVERETGKRGEADNQTYLSAYNRNKDLTTGFIGGECRECGTQQIPKARYCVNPECGALDSQDDHAFANKSAVVKTWTADKLTFDWDPPAYYGLVEFNGGGRLMMDFTEVGASRMDVGKNLSMHFRIKQFDNRRGFRRYFWKARLED